ncbi:hypothetical protein [Chryseobacterium koreense]|uniref:hypothetical protein n=1 Tax=Chryseobacterium koreense TaxID=232216 RepID=UPI0026EE8354|nr:hypothetical protein [Chryseobacterium koreense]
MKKIAEETGLQPANNKEPLLEREIENKNFNALVELSAVNSIRQLDAHKTNDPKTRLHKASTDLGIQSNAISNNYADACWHLYYSIEDMFRNANGFRSSLGTKLLQNL